MFFGFFFASFFLLTSSQSIQPPAIPLAVRTPYLQAYLTHTSATTTINNWPSFWTGNHTLGWSGLLRVDGVPYEWLGRAVEDGGLSNTSQVADAIFTGYQVTPTRTVISLTAGAMALNVTFLSPIEPTDLVKQSFPFTYVFFEASSTDGKAHSLEIYQDFSGEWTSSNTNNVVRWNTTTDGSIIFHEAQRSPFQFMTELQDMAEDAVLYHVAPNASGLTYQTGQDIVVRSLFLNNGTLNNTQDNAFRAISSDWPVFAFCQDLGTIQSTSTPLVWGLGIVRNSNIIYTTPSGNQTREPYFLTEFPDVPTAMTAFMSDASSALSRATTLDNKIVTAANGISSNYVDLVSLASRQVMAGMEITVGTNNGQINNSDVLFFMKDTGNSQRTNPVEVMYAALPAFLYLNASWTAYLVEPLLQFQSSSLYSASFASSDLGNSFPAAIGDTDPVFNAIESTSDILTMAWAHATFTGDASLISQYYPTLKKWTDTLVSENPLTPNGFITADNQDLANMTNLAIKGILAIRTMAEISNTLGETADRNSYSSTAASLLSQWQNLAASSGHLTSTYGSTNSWGLMYNMFPDKLFGFNFIPANIYSEQNTWYGSEITAAGSSTFGLPFDSNEPTTAKTQWNLFTAATVNDTSIRDSLVSYVHSSASNLKNFAAFPTTYSTTDGSIQGGTASPAQGAMYALLALSLPKQDASSFASANSSSKKSNAGAIAGGVVGGIAFFALIGLAFLFFRRRRMQSDGYNDDRAGGFAMMFRPKKSRTYASQEALSGFQIDPLSSNELNFTNTSGVTTSRSNIVGTPTTSSFGEPNPYRGPLSPPVGSSRAPPLHVYNAGDGEEGYNSQAPPLPRKVVLATTANSPPSSTSGPSVVSSSDPPSSNAASELRNEVENLRREMQEMRSRTAYEPPPEYQ